LARGLEPASQNGTFAPPHLTTFSLELIDLRANRRVAAPLLLVLPVEPTGGVPGLRATRRLRARSARGGRVGAALILLNPVFDEAEQMERLMAEVVPKLS